MTLPNQSKQRKLQLANSKRVERMGLHNDKAVQFLLQLSLSPIPDVAFRFSNKLSHMLDEMEFRNAVHGCEALPVLGSDISIEIGKTISKGEPYRIKINDLTTHMLVYGATGWGKTNFASLIVQALAGVVHAILFDHKDEGLRFANLISDSAYLPPEKFRWNPLCGAGKQTDYIHFISSQLAKFLSLLPITAHAARAKLLHLCADKTNLPSIADLSALFTAFAKQEMRASHHTASRGFGDLATAMGNWAEVRHGSWPFDNHPLIAIPLKDCPLAFEHFLIATLFKQLTDRASASGHTTALNRFVLFDEGRGFFGKELEPATGSGRTNLQSEILTKMRSYGIGCVICTQSLSGIQQAVIDNSGIFIAFKSNSEQEAKACCRRLGFDESRYIELMNMDIGTAWVVSPLCHQPVKIRVPFMDLGDYPSEADIINRMEPLYTKWDAEAVFTPAKDDTDTMPDFRIILGEIEPEENAAPTESEEPEPPEQSTDTAPDIPVPPAPNTSPILAEYFSLLRSSEANPTFAVTAHYKSLGWSVRKGNRIKAKLLELGWAESERAVTGKSGRPSELLKPTTKGKGAMNNEIKPGT